MYTCVLVLKTHTWPTNASTHACRFACKEIDIGGYRGWRLKVVEAFIIILTFTQLLYVLLLHAGVFSSKYGPGYRDSDYGMGPAAGTTADPTPKGGGVVGSRV